MLQVGSIVGGRLRVDQLLGAGGMGVVVAATHLELGHRVAVKVLREELAENQTIVERFIREARAVVNLRTEHVCRVFDVGRLDSGAPYIVMELLEGADLQRAIAKRALPPPTAVDYVLQACVALAEAHAAGIVHRDLKPANLFVTRRLDGGPLVKVLDFGIAKAMVATGPQLTHANGLMGSPGYMSPEQLQSARDVDARSDIWSLGVTLYQLLAARMPFAAATLTEIAVKVATDPPAPLDVDPALAAVVLRCLEKDPDRRYPSAAALAADLVRFASNDGRRAAALAAQLGGVSSMSAPAPAPMVAMGAPTAASVASMAPMPAAPTPMAPTPATPPSPAPLQALGTGGRAARRWPLIVGALVLVGATVAITLALGNKDSSRTTSSPAPEATAPGSATVVIAVDAGASASPPTTTPTGDPWATSAPTREIDAAVEQPEPEVDLGDMDAFLSTDTKAQLQQAKEQAKASCKQVVANADLARNPALSMQIALCWCVLGDRTHAQQAFDGIKDKNTRTSTAQLCRFYGMSLHL